MSHFLITLHTGFPMHRELNHILQPIPVVHLPVYLYVRSCGPLPHFTRGTIWCRSRSNKILITSATIDGMTEQGENVAAVASFGKCSQIFPGGGGLMWLRSRPD